MTFSEKGDKDIQFKQRVRVGAGVGVTVTVTVRVTFTVRGGGSLPDFTFHFLHYTTIVIIHDYETITVRVGSGLGRGPS